MPEVALRGANRVEDGTRAARRRHGRRLCPAATQLAEHGGGGVVHGVQVVAAFQDRDATAIRNLLGDSDPSIDMWELNREKQDKPPAPAQQQGGRGGRRGAN